MLPLKMCYLELHLKDCSNNLKEQAVHTSVLSGSRMGLETYF